MYQVRTAGAHEAFWFHWLFQTCVRLLRLLLSCGIRQKTANVIISPCLTATIGKYLSQLLNRPIQLMSLYTSECPVFTLCIIDFSCWSTWNQWQSYVISLVSMGYLIYSGTNTQLNVALNVVICVTEKCYPPEQRRYRTSPDTDIGSLRFPKIREPQNTQWSFTVWFTGSQKYVQATM